MKKTLRILGIRGVPAAHGGFETFAEHLSRYLVANGWRVVVYCQVDGDGGIATDVWEGVERVNIPVSQSGPRGTIVFDWHATAHAARHQDLCLTLGYNTAIFCARLRLAGVRNLINMDGVEWKREKWSAPAKLWFWLNDWAGCLIGNHLVADHPEIKRHLTTRVDARKITTVPYGARDILAAPVELIHNFQLTPREYFTVIARPEPENSLLEIVRGFSLRRRGKVLVVLGKYDPANTYHRRVLDAASPEVRFLGAIYDNEVVGSLRFFSRAYVHGHQVGGTNPSLVEAMGAGNAVIAHDNKYNRWVAGESALYFRDADSIGRLFDEVSSLDGSQAVRAMAEGSKRRFAENFTWDKVLREYEELLLQYA